MDRAKLKQLRASSETARSVSSRSMWRDQSGVGAAAVAGAPRNPGKARPAADEPDCDATEREPAQPPRSERSSARARCGLNAQLTDMPAMLQ
jgi:hypothetical protein